jgi:hypothetical protein
MALSGLAAHCSPRWWCEHLPHQFGKVFFNRDIQEVTLDLPPVVNFVTNISC